MSGEGAVDRPVEGETPSPGASDEPLSSPGDDAPDAIFESLWGRVLEAWDEDKPHVALLDHAVRSQSLPTLAGRYKALVSDPERGARAQARLDALVGAAMAMLESTKMPEITGTPRSWTLSVAVVCLVAIAYVVYRVASLR